MLICIGDRIRDSLIYIFIGSVNRAVTQFSLHYLKYICPSLLIPQADAFMRHPWLLP